MARTAPANPVTKTAASRARGVPHVRVDVDPDFEPHVAGIDYGTLEELVGYAVRRAQIRLYDDFYRTLAPWDISPQRFSAMTVISRNPGLRLTQLGHILGIAGSGVVTVVRALEALGYVTRTSAAGDARAHNLSLTGEGRRVLRRIDEAVREHDRRMSAVLTDDERDTLVRLLSRLAGDAPDGRRMLRRRR